MEIQLNPTDINAPQVCYTFQWKEFVALENITGYLKSHLTKYRHVCTHTRIDAFFMLIPNMGIQFNKMLTN